MLKVRLSSEMSGSDTLQEKMTSCSKEWIFLSIQMNLWPLLENQDVEKVHLSTCSWGSTMLIMVKSYSTELTSRTSICMTSERWSPWLCKSLSFSTIQSWRTFFMENVMPQILKSRMHAILRTLLSSLKTMKSINSIKMTRPIHLFLKRWRRTRSKSKL